MNHANRTAVLILVLGAVIGLAFSAWAQTPPDRPSLKRFDDDVARCRREMRASCGIVQELMTVQQPDASKRAEALENLKHAREQWATIGTRYQDNAPAEYARDAQWKGRLADIGFAMDDMLAHLEAGRFKRSFQSCGSGCGLFVAMHEDNNLVYALDRLFYLRKTAKTVVAVSRNTNLDGVADVLPALLEQRNRVLVAPCPCPEDARRCRQYQTALRNISGGLDDLAIAVGRKDAATAAGLLDELVASANEAYGAAL